LKNAAGFDKKKGSGNSDTDDSDSYSDDGGNGKKG